MANGSWEKIRLVASVVGVIAGCATIAVGITTNWGWAKAPSASLVAEVEFTRFIWPPGLQKDLPFDFSLVRGIWLMAVKNDGNAPVSSISLKLPKFPTPLFISVEKEGTQQEAHAATTVVALGDLRPQEAASVVVWTDSAPTTGYADGIKISHASGIGSVVVRAPAGPMWWRLERNWLLYIFLASIFGSLVLAILATNQVFARLQKSDDEQSKPSAPEIK